MSFFRDFLIEKRKAIITNVLILLNNFKNFNGINQITKNEH